MAARHAKFIEESRQASNLIWQGYNKLQALQAEWTSAGYTDNMPDENADYSKQAVSDVVNTTTDALETFMAAGHATNLTRLL